MHQCAYDSHLRLPRVHQLFAGIFTVVVSTRKQTPADAAVGTFLPGNEWILPPMAPPGWLLCGEPVVRPLAPKRR